MKTWSRIVCCVFALLLAGAAPAANDLSAILGARAGFSAVGNFSIAGTATGVPDKLTLKATLQVAPEDAGKAGMVYVIASLPGMTFFRQADGAWVYWVGGDFPANFQGTLGTHEVNVIEDADLSQLPGVGFYVGYGTSQADMLDNGKYSKLSTQIQSASLDGIWQIVSSTAGFFGEPPTYLYIYQGIFLLGDVGPDDCVSYGEFAVSGDIALATVVYNNASKLCGQNDVPGTVHQFKFKLDQNYLTLIATDGSSALFQRLDIPL